MLRVSIFVTFCDGIYVTMVAGSEDVSAHVIPVDVTDS